MNNIYIDISDNELKLLHNLVRSRVRWYLSKKIVGYHVLIAEAALMRMESELKLRFPDGWEQEWPKKATEDR